MEHATILLMVLALALGIGSIATVLRYRSLYRLEFIGHLLVFLIALNAAALIGVFFNYFGANLEQHFSSETYRWVDTAYRLTANIILLAVGGSLLFMLQALVDRQPSRRYLAVLFALWVLITLLLLAGIWVRPEGLPVPVTVLANITLDQLVQYLVLFECLRAAWRTADLQDPNRRRSTRVLLTLFGGIWAGLIVMSFLMFSDTAGSELFNLLSAVIYVILNALPLTLLGPFLRSAFGSPIPAGVMGTSNLEQLATRFGISPRELDVLRLICRGYPNQRIADELFISLSTVKDHNHKLFRKLGVGSRTELVARVTGTGEALWVSSATATRS